MTTTSSPAGQIGPGLAALRFEMSKQHQDSLESFRSNADIARKIAASLRRTGRLILLGMGGSQAVNRMAEPDYRAVGLKALAVSLSEQLYSPLPLGDATVITRVSKSLRPIAADAAGGPNLTATSTPPLSMSSAALVTRSWSASSG